ncbi:MAG: hypothetical protein ABL962_02885, partial [Fimbriimonadaceae bacterium]
FEYHFAIAPSLGWTAEEVCTMISGCGDYAFTVLHADDTIHPMPPDQRVGDVCNVIATPRA